MSINDNKFNQKGINLLLNFKQKYGNIKFKIEGMSEYYKKYTINKYKIETNFKNLTNEILNEKLTPEIIANSVAAYIYNLNHKKLILDEKLNNICYIKENISNVLYISFTRNNST